MTINSNNNIIYFVLMRDNKSLFTSQFSVEAGEANAKGLERTDGPRDIHSKDVARNFPELEDNVFIICIGYKLKVLHARQRDTSVEVQAVRLHGFIPLWRLVP